MTLRSEYLYQHLFRKAEGFEEVSRLRKMKTNDIVHRIGVLSPNRIFIHNYPISNPSALFNPSLIIDEGAAYLYARIIVGYYMYVSAIVEIPIPLEDIESGNLNLNYYPARLVVYPSTRYDLWGTEDPRTYKLGDKVYMTYTGRTINYFNSSIRIERTLPVTAIMEGRNDASHWRKIYVHHLPEELRSNMVSNKDAFLWEINGKRYFFHRPHMSDEKFYLAIGSEGNKWNGSDGITEIEIIDNIEVMRPPVFEDKVGWSTPPINIGSNKIIVFLHGVDKDVKVYRLFAAELEFRKDNVIVNAVTPNYIMEPKQPYEIFGDRPYTIFPCGAWKIDDHILLTYGAGDYMVGFGKMLFDDLLSELDKGRIF